jgi:competence protein CoiA
MLIGSLDGRRVDAAEAERGAAYLCPECKSTLILKKGRIVVAHFAHKPPTICAWGLGETSAHLLAKRLLHDAFVKRGIRAEVEFPIATLPGDRRADVMAWPWTRNGKGVAFELQHSVIGLEEIEARASSYAGADIAQIWIPFLPPKLWQDAERIGVDRFRVRYAPRAFERWIHGFNGSHGMWLFEAQRCGFWHGRLSGYRLWVEESEWFDEYGEEHSAGGYYRWSSRWRNLELVGPFQADDLETFIHGRQAYQTDRYRWPAGSVAHLRLRREHHDLASRLHSRQSSSDLFSET